MFDSHSGMVFVVSAAILWSVALVGGPPTASAVVVTGETAGLGISANLDIGGGLVATNIPQTPILSGTSPPPHNVNANLAGIADVQLFNGETIIEISTGESDLNGVSDVDGFAGVRSATADATVADVFFDIKTEINAGDPLQSYFKLEGDSVASDASVAGDFGGLATAGSTTLLGSAGANNDQVRIEVLGVEFLLPTAPPANGPPLVIDMNDVPNLEGIILVTQNEQILIGDGSTNQDIQVTALRVDFQSGIITLPGPGGGIQAFNGQIIVDRSFAQLTAEEGGSVGTVPEPSTIWLALTGLIGLWQMARRRCNRA